MREKGIQVRQPNNKRPCLQGRYYLPLIDWIRSLVVADSISLAPAQAHELAHSVAPPLRKRSRSDFLFGCKRPHDENPSLPTFCGFPAGFFGAGRVRSGVSEHETRCAKKESRFGSHQRNLFCLPRQERFLVFKKDAWYNHLDESEFVRLL